MKKTISRIALVVSLVTVTCLTQSCTKKGCTDEVAFNYDTEAEKDDGSCTYGGLGGNTTIVAKPQHHGATIYNLADYSDSAYVKFDAINSPGTDLSQYDLKLAGDSGEDHVHIEGLKPGKYYIYMAGFDTSINERVRGGIPINLTQSSGELELVVPVTED